MNLECLGLLVRKDGRIQVQRTKRKMQLPLNLGEASGDCGGRWCEGEKGCVGEELGMICR